MRTDQIFAGLALYKIPKKIVKVCLFFPKENRLIIAPTIPEIMFEAAKIGHSWRSIVTYERPFENLPLENGESCELLDFCADSVEVFKSKMKWQLK